MSIVSSTLSTTSGADTDPVIRNQVTVADTEVAVALPANCKGFLLRSRNRSVIQLSYSVGQSNTLFVTLRPNTVYTDENFYLAQAIYFRTIGSADVVEIVTFV